jgi:hypothetical protein
MGTGVGRERVTMPFDLSGLFDSITHGIAKVPSAVMAAVILGGPTAIWLITRFVHPPEVVKAAEVPTQDRLWLCGSCLSINEDRHAACYRCNKPRAAESMPVVIHGAPAAPRIGIAVGPGRGEGVPTAGWLGGEFVATAFPTETRRRTGKATVPAPARLELRETIREQAIAAESIAAQSDSPSNLEPQILEPRVKVSTRASASKQAGRRGRQPQGAGEAN